MDKSGFDITIITAISASLGFIATICLFHPSRSSLYVLSLCLYHMLEFVITSVYQPHNACAHSFLIYGARGSKEFTFVQICSVLEHYIWTRSKFSSYSTFCTISGLGAVIVGQCFRSIAMVQCGSQFSHYISTRRTEKDQLITSGIYSISRHPSYVGFFLLMVGQQILLSNIICLLGGVVTLVIFFNRRIKFEEHFLIHKYGAQYTQYQQKVRAWI